MPASDEVRAIMEAREKADNDEASRLYHTVTKASAEGRAQGKEEALGEIVQRLRKQNMSDIDITTLLGLPPDYFS